MASTTVNWVIFCGLLCLFIVSSNTQEQMLGEGVWSVTNAKECEDDDRYPYQILLRRKKMTRDSDGFIAHFDLKEDVDESFGVRIDFCKWMDGGCKSYTTLTDDCFCCFVKKTWGRNFGGLLKAGGIDPPDCPIPKGTYDVEDFVFNYDDLPPEGVYGEFDVKLFLTKDNTDLTCTQLAMLFEKKDD